MSAASRNLARLARHFERMSREAAEWDGGMPLYSASETWERARLMTQSTADEETWRHRIWSCRDGVVRQVDDASFAAARLSCQLLVT